MSFFKRDRDLSTYPQPVLVTPDPRAQETNDDEHEDDIAKEVAEAASTSIHDSDHSTEATPPSTTAQTKGKGRADASADTPMAKDGKDPSVLEPPSQGAADHAAEGADGNFQDEEGPLDADPTFQDGQDQRAWTDGIMSVIGPVIQEMDFNIVSVRKSQVELEKEIERLTAELQLFIDSAATPPEVEPAIRKLSLARKQIMTASTTLRTVQDRVDRMCAQVQPKR